MFCCQSCKYESDRKFNIRKHIINVHKRDATDEELTKKSENTQISTTNAQIIFQPTQISSETTQISSKNTQNSSENTQISPHLGKKFSACDKCKKMFKTLHGLKKHQSTCKGVSNILECHFCHNVFSTYQSKSKHLKICKIRLAQEQVQQVLEMQQAEVQHTNNIVNHNTTNTNNNNQQIINNYNNFNSFHISKSDYNDIFGYDLDNENVEYINDFGKEDISYITDEQMRDFASNHNLDDYVIAKHFNNDHPENRNIRFNDSKSYKILQNKQWLAKPKNKIGKAVHTDARIRVFDYGYKHLYPTYDADKQEVYMECVKNYNKKENKDIVIATIDVQVNEHKKVLQRKLKAIQSGNNVPAICNT